MSRPRYHDLFDELWPEWVENAETDANTKQGVCCSHAGSNLERLLLSTLMFIRPDAIHGGQYGGPLMGWNGLLIQPQWAVGPYWLDFAVLATTRWGIAVSDFEIKIAVECDGHYFHDRTKEQVGRDKRRDRFLVENGWRVMRFTETEINDDPRACAQQVSDAIDRIAGGSPS
mgnify:CR=1 FL=1